MITLAELERLTDAQLLTAVKQHALVLDRLRNERNRRARRRRAAKSKAPA